MKAKKRRDPRVSDLVLEDVTTEDLISMVELLRTARSWHDLKARDQDHFAEVLTETHAEKRVRIEEAVAHRAKRDEATRLLNILVPLLPTVPPSAKS